MLLRILRSPYGSRLVLASLVAFILLALSSCGKDAGSPVAPGSTRPAADEQNGAPGGTGSANGQVAVDICHRTGGTNSYVPISVPQAALEAHLAHGDVVVGGPVPGQPGMVFDAHCAAVPAGPVTITFDGFLVDRAPFSTYTASGFTVTPETGSWVVWTKYGHPAPAVVFEVPAGAPATTATMKITAGGSPFKFAAVDLYSSVTPIPYVFTGLSKGTTIFTVTGTRPNTFGNFVNVVNPRSADTIDTLLIALTIPAMPACCGNPMGLDNIALTR